MKLSFLKRDQLILGAGLLVLVLLVVYFQFFYITPLKSDYSIQQQSLQNEQRLLEISSQKKAASAKSVAVDTRELQKKLPVKPLEDQFILDLGKAETLSGSTIKSMSFAQDQNAAPANSQPNGNGQQTTQNGSAQAASSQNTAAQGTTNQSNAAGEAGTKAAASPATGLKKLTVNLSVESPSYDMFEKFIQTLESLNRILVVESINYTGGDEITSLDQQNQKLTYTLVISAYYMPSLTDLDAQLPKVDAPAPAGKDNPLSQFPDSANAK